jgi:hypothetical protein
MSLLRDITRCHGEGNWESVCRKREQCQRYLDKGQPGDRLVWSMALCRGEQWQAWIPVEKETGK